MNKSTTIGAALAALRKEVADRQSAMAILEALVATGASDAGHAEPGTSRRRRRGKTRPGGVGQITIEIIRAAGRPLHGLREIVPALQARGLKPRSTAGLATTLLRTGAIERTAPGTFGLKVGARGSGDATDTKN